MRIHCNVRNYAVPARALLFGVAFTLNLRLVDAQEPPSSPIQSAPTVPPAATKDEPQPETPPTERDVEDVFKEQLQALDDYYCVRWKALQRERIDGLQRLSDDATIKKKADDAAALHEKIVAIEAEIAEASEALKTGTKPDAAAAALAKLLRGTTWQWTPADTVRFDEDGKVSCADWNSRGLRTNWRAIDRRTVLLYIVAGRTENRYAILKFGPGVQSFTQYPFEGTPYDPKSRTERARRRN